MKAFLFLLLSTVTVGALAQYENLHKRRPWETYKKKLDLRNSPSPRIAEIPGPGDPVDGVLKLPLKGKYLGKTEAGDDVYAITPDNMPCLVPGSALRSNMPVGGRKRDLRLNKENDEGTEK